MLADMTLSDDLAFDDSIIDPRDLQDDHDDVSEPGPSTLPAPQARFEPSAYDRPADKGAAVPKGAATKAKPRFSLFAAGRAPNQRSGGAGGSRPDEDDTQRFGLRQSVSEQEEEDEEDEDGAGADEGGEEETARFAPRESSQTAPAPSSAERDAKLRESLYELRKMNDVFEEFLSALEAARGHNQVRKEALFALDRYSWDGRGS